MAPEIAPRAGWVSLTYDGLLPSHRDFVLPALAEAGLRGTFFGGGAQFAEEAAFWRSVAQEGHELGNGALRELQPYWSKMSANAILEEVRDLQTLLAELSHDIPVAPIAWPFGSPRAGDPDLDFGTRAVIRSGLDGINRIGITPPKSPIPVVATGKIQQKLCELAELALQPNNWLIFSFEEVNKKAHQSLLDWLVNHPEVRVGTLNEVANAWQLT